MKEIHVCIPSHDLSPRSSVSLHSFLLPGTDKEQRAHERQQTAHRNPTVKHSLTLKSCKKLKTDSGIYSKDSPVVQGCPLGDSYFSIGINHRIKRKKHSQNSASGIHGHFFKILELG